MFWNFSVPVFDGFLIPQMYDFNLKIYDFKIYDFKLDMYDFNAETYDFKPKTNLQPQFYDGFGGSFALMLELEFLVSSWDIPSMTCPISLYGGIEVESVRPQDISRSTSSVHAVRHR